MSTNNSKILYVTSVLRNGWPGGEPIVAKNTIDALKSNGYNVTATYYRSKFGNFLTMLFNKFRALFSSSDHFMLSYLYYKRIIRREKPDIVIAQYDYDSSIIKAAVDENKKIIVYVHIWWPVCPKITLFTYEGTICQGFTNSDCKTCASKTYKGGATKYALLLLTNNKIHKKMRNRIDLLNKDDVTTVVLSSHMKEYFVNFGLPEEKIKILPNGITCKNFTIDNDTREKIVCYYGGESDFKGFEIFYTIAKILNTKYPDIQFIATGNYQNKSPLVKYVGMLDREKLKSLYAKSKCTVIPSIWDDPFPAVALESMAAGTPVVAFDVGSLSSIIHNEVGGFVVPLMGIDEMADKIIRVVNDDKLFAKLSENARRIACEEFTEDKRIALLNEIINKSSR